MPFNLGLRSAALNPAVTGLLLFALTGAPSTVREPLLEQLSRLPAQVSVARVVKVLKWLFALGLVHKANAWLNSLALNGWTRKADTERWVWREEVAVITGGSSGIGALLAQGLAEKGVKVAVLDVQPLSESLKSYSVFFQHCDVTDHEAVAAAANAVRASLGHPSILINNAGIATATPIIETPPAHVQKVLGVNLISHWFTCAEFVPDMIKKNKGHVVTIASMASFVTPGGVAPYASSKNGALAFHECLAQELRHLHDAPSVHTTIAHPSWTRTPLTEANRAALEKRYGTLLTAESVADEILAQIFSCRNGQLFMPNGLSKVSGLRGWPNWAQEFIRGRAGRFGKGQQS
ncbi:uncharacterized protein K452DRAFT_285142 [Aplosporella prunicola CBS 121167]|uniref:Short-chain dehydrogenase/reductase 3 n=1 Tax=Aplosporella prunicola CBS 121167 TaxID=1176127 RepID=A0A6A6BL11_9PEZI|nr:uncharacterized protein K452DRAFT_285142 [Aplosporella prunicola CBS 121167]KAF2144812.1 hypothetical protein K452DRAFT_285142 [Aplosporella prunicola CBS 121167]